MQSTVVKQLLNSQKSGSTLWSANWRYSMYTNKIAMQSKSSAGDNKKGCFYIQTPDTLVHVYPRPEFS